jgi:hypothetical protein
MQRPIVQVISGGKHHCVLRGLTVEIFFFAQCHTYRRAVTISLSPLNSTTMRAKYGKRVSVGLICFCSRSLS